MTEAEGLLGPDDPPPIELLNASGGAPALLLCDHASRAVPRALGRLGLDDALLMRHIGWDIGAAEVTRHLSRRFDAPAVMTGYSRLVIDCNRVPGEPQSIPEVSDGVRVPGNCGIAPAEALRRRRALYDPYHAAVDAAIDRFRRAGRVPAILSIHSCTPVMNGEERPWHVGVLHDRDTRIAAPLMAALAARGDVCVGDNKPYSGRGQAGKTIHAHAHDVGLPHVMVEIRQDLIDTHKGAAAWARVLGDALAPILADPALYRVVPSP
ncbi:MAG: N-formylglutamate amidohydrolase [Alphaproteobacteria bacterium]|nr:N-formylglutamate amidohydrolase [Alphaproteobacteria bacterium]